MFKNASIYRLPADFQMPEEFDAMLAEHPLRSPGPLELETRGCDGRLLFRIAGNRRGRAASPRNRTNRAPAGDEMSDLSKRLRASMRCDAINGDSFERSVCARQMREAADTLDKLAADIAERDTQLFERDAEIRSLAHSLEVAQTALRAADSVIAERDAQISELTAERDEARTAYQVRNTEWHQHELIALALAERHKLRAERAEAELARLRGQEPAAWQFEWIHSGNKWRTHFNAEKPCDLDCYRNVQPLYAEPMPSKESK